MHWLSQNKVFQTARNIEVRSPGPLSGIEGVHTNDLEDNEEGVTLSSKDHVVFMPSLSRTYSLWYRGRYMTVTRSRISESNMWRGPLDMLKIRYAHIPSTTPERRSPLKCAFNRMLARDSGLVRELLREARKAYKAANGHLINVYVAQG